MKHESGGFLLETIFTTLIIIIQKLGYFGIFASTALEYACFPISSELLLPFIGFTVSKGEMNLIYTILASTIGGVVGCSFCYCIGRFGGKFIDRMLCPKFKGIRLGIEHARGYFNRYGKQSVLLARVIPLARTYISIPAGMAKMNYTNFVLYSALGAFIWNTILISLGYFLGDHWDETAFFMGQHKSILFFMTVIVCIVVVYHIFFKQKKRKIKKRNNFS